jgi:DNA-binding MarR family transcriptional regulator
MAHWGFLTNHALVLTFVVRHPASTVREISGGVGVTERATLAILRELDLEGIVERRRDGRRNTYSVNFERLAAYRRSGTVALTPRPFVDGLVSVLLGISSRANGAGELPELDSGALEPRIGRWGFFTNHALLLLSIALEHTSTVRELALGLGVTERAVVAILNQLEEEGIVLRRRIGRRNEYEIDFGALRRFPRWSPGEWQLPPQLIDAAVQGLQALSSAGAAPVAT